jgi:hypothetical protein
VRFADAWIERCGVLEVGQSPRIRATAQMKHAAIDVRCSTIHARQEIVVQRQIANRDRRPIARTVHRGHVAVLRRPSSVDNDLRVSGSCEKAGGDNGASK